jgi:hypothetical protein
MSKNSTTWFTQYKITQFAIVGNKSRLLPNSVAGRRIYATSYHIADFTFSVNTNYMNNFASSHELTINPDLIKVNPQFENQKPA